MPFSNLFQTLFSVAEAYLALGYSPIPLLGDGDPSRAKVAAVPWAAYQKVKPSLSQCRGWFLDDQFEGLGIVTGTISRLAVLDFDTPDSFRDFEIRFPSLAQTNVIQTRRGYHIYFRLPPNFQLASRKGGGVDLLAEGSYVVARPTVIDGHAYKLIRGGQPALLSLDAVHNIHSFLDSRKKVPSSEFRVPREEKDISSQNTKVSNFKFTVTSENELSSVLSTQYSALSSLSSELRTRNSELFSVLPLYRYLISRGEGRNQALFHAGLTARDNGWTQEQTFAALAPAHSDQKSPVAHISESEALRQREAFNTIRSVYSRPRRPQLIRVVINAGLPNTVREHLFRNKQTGLVRVWEGLRLKGIRPGTIFTTQQAVTLLKGIVGRDSIHQALNAHTPAGQGFFSLNIPSGHPKASNDAAAVQRQETTKKMHFGRAQKPGINGKGRPARGFVMPDPLEWCAQLGLETAFSDPVTLDDLSSAKQTRMAVHREMIKRRPGTYPRRFLAGRLGVSLGSIDTYNDEIPIFSREQFIETRLCWSNLHLIPDDFTLEGVFLEDASGKRYPALRPLAARLLNQGKTITYKRQDANYYWYGEVPSSQFPVPREEKEREDIVAARHVVPTIMTVQNGVVGTGHALSVPIHNMPQPIMSNPIPNAPVGTRYISSAPTPLQQPALPTMTLPKIRSSPDKKPKPKREPSGRRRLKDEALETLATRIYEKVNGRSADPSLHISMVVSRKLVSRYDRATVEKALRLLETRRDVAKPAGFFVTVLRSEAKRFP